MATRFGKTGWVGAAAIAAALIPSLMASRAEGQSISLYELARFSLNSVTQSGSANYIGNNPIAVGWNGSKLYVAGQLASGATASIGIIEITNAANVTNGSAVGFVTPTFSSMFGALSTTAGNGYRGLSLKGNQLAVAWDSGANSPNSYRLFDASTNTLTWSLTSAGTTTIGIGTARGQAGAGFDPGYQGNAAQGSGFAWMAQGAGTRGLNNVTTGSAIYTNANATGFTRGMTLNTNPTSTTWRDIAFDPATGDIYTRNQNGVTRANRTGINTVQDPTNSTNAQSALIWTQPTPGNNIATNLAYMNAVTSSTFNAFSNTYAGDLLVFNNRSSTATGQSWTDVIKFTTTSGSSITPNWTFLAAPATGNAAYDFEWDQTTQTLAVVDYNNRNVSIFSTAVPEPSTWAMLVIGGGVSGFAALRRRLRRQG